MAWTYSGDPSMSTLDAVRFLVGDTHEDEPLVQDEEISWVLAENTNVYAAAAQVAESIAAFFATQPDSFKVGPILEDAKTRAKNYLELAQRLSMKASSKQTLEVFAGGTEDPEATPSFEIGMHDDVVEED